MIGFGISSPISVKYFDIQSVKTLKLTVEYVFQLEAYI